MEYGDSFLLFYITFEVPLQVICTNTAIGPFNQFCAEKTLNTSTNLQITLSLQQAGG